MVFGQFCFSSVRPAIVTSLPSLRHPENRVIGRYRYIFYSIGSRGYRPHTKRTYTSKCTRRQIRGRGRQIAVCELRLKRIGQVEWRATGVVDPSFVISTRAPPMPTHSPCRHSQNKRSAISHTIRR